MIEKLKDHEIEILRRFFSKTSYSIINLRESLIFNAHLLLVPHPFKNKNKDHIIPSYKRISIFYRRHQYHLEVILIGSIKFFRSPRTHPLSKPIIQRTYNKFNDLLNDLSSSDKDSIFNSIPNNLQDILDN